MRPRGNPQWDLEATRTHLEAGRNYKKRSYTTPQESKEDITPQTSPPLLILHYYNICAQPVRVDVLIAFATLLTFGWSTLPIMKRNIVTIIIVMRNSVIIITVFYEPP